MGTIGAAGGVRVCALGALIFVLLMGALTTASRPSEALVSDRASPGTCGLAPTSDPDCARRDLGSCGNACCGVSVVFVSDSAEAVVQALSRELARRGSDGAFTPATTWGSFFNLDQGGCRSLSATETRDRFLCQATHTTDGPYRFKDTINIKVGAAGPKGTPVNFFSISNVAGALGDAGQNYKNIQLLVRALEAQGLRTLRPGQPWIGCAATA